MAKLFQPLLFFLARCTDRDLRKQIEFLKAENEMLRKRVPKKRIFLTDDERNRLLKLGKAIGPGVCHLITIVHPRTYQRWISEKKAGKPKKKMGRPKTLESIREIVIRLAKETGWGYGRILGELRKLRIRCISRSTVKNILKEQGIKPGPKRGNGTWDEFLKIHAETLWQVDFFSKMIWTPTGLRQAFVLAFMHVGARRVFCSPCSFKPDAKWMVRQAEDVIEQAHETNLPLTHLIRDRDGKYVREFDQVFKDIGCRVEPTAPQAPNQNAFIERWIKSIRVECLSFFVVFGKKHLDHLVSTYQEFYNELRPHQTLDNRPLTGQWPEVDDPLPTSEQIVCHERLGGVLRITNALPPELLLSSECRTGSVADGYSLLRGWQEFVRLSGLIATIQSFTSTIPSRFIPTQLLLTTYFSAATTFCTVRCWRSVTSTRLGRPKQVRRSKHCPERVSQKRSSCACNTKHKRSTGLRPETRVFWQRGAEDPRRRRVSRRAGREREVPGMGRRIGAQHAWGEGSYFSPTILAHLSYFGRHILAALRT